MVAKLTDQQSLPSALIVFSPPLPRNLPYFFILLIGFTLNTSSALIAQSEQERIIPRLSHRPNIDGDLNDWKKEAFSEGEWDMDRIKKSNWYSPKRNRLVLDAGEDSTELDLLAEYYLAWDEEYLYFGAEVKDNVHDVQESNHEAKRWYYKDAIALFIEFPIDSLPEKFESGDHAFCFVIDTTMPDYGAWWRHGSEEGSYQETPLPALSVDYQIKMNPWNRSKADYILEARIDLKSTVGESSDSWTGLNVSDYVGLMIVHCDPDGGEYGGHMLIYGQGDNDATWTKMRLADGND